MLSIIFIGLALGSIYGLAAVAMGISWQTSRTIDLAIGAYAAIGGITAASLPAPWGIFAGLLAATGLGWLMGVIFLFLNRRGLSDTISSVFASIGVLFASTSFVLWWFGTNPFRQDFLHGVIRIGDGFISKQGGFNTLVAVGVAVVIALIFKFSTLGYLLTASAINPRSAELTGIPVRRLQCGAFAASGLVAGIAGILLSFTKGISYSLGLSLTIAAFGALIVLGAKNTTLIFIGGLLLGLVEAWAMAYLPSSYASMAPLFFILITLMLGKFGDELGERV